ncbi:MAG: histidine phosphatase family protein [Burkholderiales bacterium]|nr:histidine phosphatase family protein [Burkholderiales bacterium]
MADALQLTKAPFWFLRHGETEINRLGLVAGQLDAELNETGWRQAREAALLLAGRGIGAIYSSPLRRARDTAGCVALELGLDAVIVPGLAERGWGVLEGRPRSERDREVTPRGGESREAFAARTLAGLAGIPPAPLPLIVAHSGTFRVLSGMLGLPPVETPIGNALPLRLVPPPATALRWTIEPAGGLPDTT